MHLLLVGISHRSAPGSSSIGTGTFGLASNYVMFHYLFAATQFTTILLLSCAHYPVISYLREAQLEGLDAYGASLGLI